MANVESTKAADGPIAIIDYNMGNVGSIANMLHHIGHDATITNVHEQLRNAKALILPGVGAFDRGMQNLRDRELTPLLTELVVEQRKPILGICLGMHLLTKCSEEGTMDGLGWIAAQTRRFVLTDESLKVPHMGWNTVRAKKDHYLTGEEQDERRFYFVHSYHVVCEAEKDVLFETYHGDWFTSGFAHENIVGVQFHPEKSHRYGMDLLARFVEGHAQS